MFATPLLQKPLALGADIVVYSATKHIDGQGRCLGGVILTSDALMKEHYVTPLRQTGPALSPFNAWVMLKGLETLDLRVRRQVETAVILADRLAARGGLGPVLYPGRDDHPQAAVARRQMSGGGTLIAFEVRAGGRARSHDERAAADRDLEQPRDSKSLITHPGTTTHQRFTAEVRASMGIGEGTLRLSVGLEHVEDLWADIDAALSAA